MACIAEILELTQDPGNGEKCVYAMPSDFRNIQDETVRRVLLAHPRDLTLADIRQASDLTLNHLGRDCIREDIPAHAFEMRRQAAKEAAVRAARGHKTRAWHALVRFWS